jgi:hypothetical protein
MTSERRRKRTRIVPRIIFQTAIAGMLPPVAACGGSTSDGSGRGAVTSTGGSIIVLAIGGFGNGSGGFFGVAAAGFGNVVALAIGGFGNGSGGFGYAGAIPLAIGGFGNYPSSGGHPSDAGADAQDGSATGGRKIWVLAMQGFGTGGKG